MKVVNISWLERAAVAVLVAWIVWAVVATALVGRVLSPTSPYVVAPVVLVVGVILGRLVAPHAAHRATAVILLATTAYFLVAVLWTSGPAKGPLAYANANAAFAVQLIAVSALVVLRTTGWRRAMAALAALLAFATVVANLSKAGVVVAIPVAVVAVVMAWWPTRRRFVALAAALFGVVTVVSAASAVVALALYENWPVWALRAFDPARQTMWQDAVTLWQEQPVLGSGPGTYEAVSRLGHDADTAAAHSSVLQIGAETGWVGVALFAAIVVMGVVFACRGSVPGAVIGTAAWTALIVHSFADHLLEFVPVMLVAGMVLGWAGTPTRDISTEEDVPQPVVQGE